MEEHAVLLTGATGRIGQVITKYLLDKGYTVIGTGRSEKSLSLLRSSLMDYSNLYLLELNFLDKHYLDKLLEYLLTSGTQINTLINNARCMDFLEIKNTNGLVSQENFLGEYLIDVAIPYELTMSLSGIESMKLECVINIGSQYGLVASNPSLYDNPTLESPIHYSVAKAALNHLTRELAVRLAPKNIKVNCIAYGGVEGRVDDAFKSRYAKLCPQGKMLCSDDLVEPIHFLMSPGSSAITGQILVVDGGWTVW